MTGCKHETHQSLLLSISMQFWWALSLQSICCWRRGGRFQGAREQRSATFLEMNENIFSKPCNFVANDKFFVIHAFFRRFSLDACNSSAQSNKKYWIGWWSCFSKYTQRLTLSFRRLADSAVHWGWLVPCRMYVCSMFYAECSRNVWGGGQRLFWPHFESIALHCRVRVGQQGSNIQMWRKHESFVQYLAHYCEIHVATK